jgi:hypothetical protein
MTIKKRLVNGLLLLAVSITLPVWAALLLVVVLICLLLMTLTPNRTSRQIQRLAFDTAWSWFQTGPLQRLDAGRGDHRHHDTLVAAGPDRAG